MNKISRKTQTIDGHDFAEVSAKITSFTEPVIIKGLVKHWPLVQAGMASDDAAIDYLKSHYNGNPAGVYFGEPSINGRFAYDESVTKLNFSVKKTPLNEMLDSIAQHKEDKSPPAIYIASNKIQNHFPSLSNDNDLPFNENAFGDLAPADADLLASIWIGNKTLVSCHFDAQKNIACCVAGRRRFTLFPPEQIDNLYPGPLEPTPGGQAISMVDFAKPDFDQHPKFAQALEHAQVAEMEPGDALFLPSMWWHQVEALNPFNILINYWWNTSPRYMGQATDALTHALLSIKDCPPAEKKAWKAIFDYYIFSDDDHATHHLPEASHGSLGKITPMSARQLRAKLINKLNR
ncbi:MAG: cupin-like domain-containing protein [Thalassotalea sp.]